MEYLVILAFVINFIYYVTKNTSALHMIQQNLYDENRRYIKWVIKNPERTLITIDLAFIINLGLIFINNKVGVIIFILMNLIYIFKFKRDKKKEQVKKPLVYTKRVKRLVMTSIVVYLIGLVSSYYLKVDLLYQYLIVSLFCTFNYFVMWIVNIINIPIEKSVSKYFKVKAIRKVKSMSELKVIGITGSYGKTSSKNILNDILSVKYNVCPTPKSFNTINGLMITINNHLDKFDEVFIAEMGAYVVNEIKGLCDFVKPKYGILTKIGTAHLETFGSQENIQKGKFELIESLPSDGVAVLNRDDELQVSYILKNNCKVIWIGINNEADVMASDIKQTNKGMTFNVSFKGNQNKYLFETKLLGTANVYNILAGIALGHYFGISVEQLKLGVKKVNSIEHRLELKKLGNINIIDDAYNSNPVGSKMALEVLNLMPGKKIIVTPGMIELGSEEYNLNKKFGEYISEVCDEVILVGEKQTKPIYDGLMSKKYNKDKIHILNDVKDAFKLIDKLKDNDTYVLLENDLPDIFNEK